MIILSIDVEWWMAQKGILETELEEDPSQSRRTQGGSIKISGTSRLTAYDDDDDDDV